MCELRIEVRVVEGVGFSRRVVGRGGEGRVRSVERMRVCLRCGKEFLSQSSANRICGGCKGVGFGVYAEPRRLEGFEVRGLRVGDAVSVVG